MWMVWDIIAILIIIICVRSAVKNGFTHSIVSVFVYVVSIIGGKYLSVKISAWAYDNYISTAIKTTVMREASTALAEGATTGADILAQFPLWLSGIINSNFPQFSEMALGLTDAQSDQLIETVTDTILDSVSGIITEVFSWFIFIILFLLLVLILKKVTRLFIHVNKIPIVGTANMFLGGVLGVIISISTLLILSMAAASVGVLTGGEFPLLNTETLDKSIIIGTIRRLLL